MSDIVERLRWDNGLESATPDELEAADEIESLRSRLAELREAARKVTCNVCDGRGYIRMVFSPHDEEFPPCLMCADLRRLMGESHE